MSESGAGGLERRIEEVVDRLDAERPPRAAEVANGAILPLLQALGWDVFDTRTVRPRVRVGGDTFDFALSDAGAGAHVVVEVHGHRHEPARRRDALQRARRAGVGLVVLTNGLAWRLFVAEADGERDRPVFELELREQEVAQSAATLRGYLARETVLSGKALRRALGTGALARAWQALVARGDSLLVELLADEVRDLVGVTPDRVATSDFLRSLAAPATHLPSPRPPVPPAHVPKGPGRGRRRVTVTLDGQSEDFGTFKDALVFVLVRLEARAPGFLASCSRDARFRMRTRCYLAGSPEAIYPTNPDLTEHHVQLDEGWYLGTNSNNAQKLEQARAACEVAGLRFGTDLTVEQHSP